MSHTPSRRQRVSECQPLWFGCLQCLSVFIYTNNVRTNQHSTLQRTHREQSPPGSPEARQSYLVVRRVDGSGVTLVQSSDVHTYRAQRRCYASAPPLPTARGDRHKLGINTASAAGGKWRACRSLALTGALSLRNKPPPPCCWQSCFLTLRHHMCLKREESFAVHSESVLSFT